MKLPTTIAASIVGVTLAGIVAAACSGNVTYAPAAYGEAGHCYYAYSTDEVGLLYAAHLCPTSWAAYPMPLYWHERYYAYYDSAAYYDHYVPGRYRTVYVSSQRTFYSTYHVQISQQSRYARYRGSNGKTVPGTKVGKTKFGSGSSFGGSGQRYGGGTRGRTTTAPRTGSTSRSRTSSGGGSSSSRRSSGGSFGGGMRRR